MRRTEEGERRREDERRREGTIENYVLRCCTCSTICSEPPLEHFQVIVYKSIVGDVYAWIINYNVLQVLAQLALLLKYINDEL